MENGLSKDRTDTIKFSGQSGEYFKLWFVNMFLSIITLGIYSAWAKVRNTQYMYGHTNVDDNSFRFLATPIQILKGRIIAVIVFILYMVLSKINPAIGIAMALVFLVASPWLIIQGMKFTLRMTAYRNVRFSFEGTYGGVIVHFILLPILGAITLYLAMPWVVQQIQQYIHNNITYGGKHFEQKSSAGQYYIAILFSIGIAVLGGALIAGFGGAAIASATAGPSLGLIIVGIAVFALFGIVNAVYQSIIYNHLMKTLDIEDVVSFDANMKTAPFAVLVLTNILLIVVTFGLAIPVVKIRTARYIASITQVTIKPGIDELINTVDGEHSAFGEEAAGLFDADLSIV
jgi:uncharacterized membrane protein YjgN (DUF898 family)